MQESFLFSGPCSAQPSLFKRLVNEFIEATREFRESPKEYLAGAIKSDSVGGQNRRARFRLGLAVSIVFYAMAFVGILVLWGVNPRRVIVTDKDGGFVLVHLLASPS